MITSRWGEAAGRILGARRIRDEFDALSKVRTEASFGLNENVLWDD